MIVQSVPVLRVTIHAHPHDLRDDWRTLQADAVGTFFQTWEWHSAWCRTAAADARETPVIVAVRTGDGTLVAVLPFAVRQTLGQRTLTWLAQNCSAYNMGLFHRDVATGALRLDLKHVLSVVRAAHPGLSSVHLDGQPFAWRGADNPFAAFGTRLVSTPLYAMDLVPSFEDMQARFSGRRRNRHRRSRRKLEAAGVTFDRIEDAPGRLAAFNEFVRQKTSQLQKRASANMYEKPQIAALYALLLNADATRDHFVVYVARCGERILAVSIGVRHGACYYDIMLSMDAGEMEQLSPGFLMVSQVIKNECEHGTDRFDFGPGLTELKATWGAEPQPRFETVMTLTAMGLPFTSVLRARRAVVHGIRARPALLQTAKYVKRALTGFVG